MENPEAKVMENLQEIPDLFNASAVYGYGSGVFAQDGYTGSMVDLLLVVEDGEKWHEENIVRFPEHYSGLRQLGAPWCTWVQQLGAGVYYNTGVTLPNGIYCKYGVITRADLLRDLWEWTHLYVPGRMHKPVAVLKADEQVWKGVEYNRTSAFKCALLLLPVTFTRHDLLMTIVGLSYRGDVRWLTGENRNKVRSIVDGQFEKLWAIYEPMTAGLMEKRPDLGPDWFQQSYDPARTRELFSTLPNTFVSLCGKTTFRSASEPWSGFAIDKALLRTNSRASFHQGVKGFFTAGVAQSASYAAAKFLKRFR